jgi:hypothetical protein
VTTQKSVPYSSTRGEVVACVLVVMDRQGSGHDPLAIEGDPIVP